MRVPVLRIRSKLLVTGIAVTLLPLIIIMATVYKQNQKVVGVGEKESLKLAYADLEHIVDNLYTLADSHQEVTQNNINAALNVARDLMEKAGGTTFSTETLPWDAVNQYTKKGSDILLPKMMVGDQWLGQISSPEVSAPLVDHVQNLLNVTCTVFQRMNQTGDMLRVSTNVIKKNGQRAIGTYIPAQNPDGQANPVISTVLRGETFKGRAFVVNAWYITAYEPILNASKEVVGVLYVGIPQENVKSLRQAIVNMKIGKGGHVTVLDSSGTYVISQGGKDDGQSVKDRKDSAGKAYIEERLKKAQELNPREIGGQSYGLAADRGEVIVHDARFVYFKPWDWIITAEANQSEFTAAASLLSKMGADGNRLIALVCIISIGITAFLWFIIANGIVKPINIVVAGLKDIAEGEGDLTMRLQVSSKDEIGELATWFNTFIEKLQGIIGNVSTNTRMINRSSEDLSTIASALSGNAQETSDRSANVAAAAEEMNVNLNNVAAAMEESTTNTSMVASAAEEMTATINEIAANAEQAHTISETAVQQALNTSTKVAELGQAAQAISKVTETITEISEQTNLLALNATIEAARAGEAGKGFAVVANEIKELAKQTAEATLDIKTQIEGVQNTTNSTVGEIDQISKIINSVNEIVATISSAVDEQSTATEEIAANISQASMGLGEVNENVSQSSVVADSITQEISSVNSASTEISGSSNQVKSSADDLLRLADELKNIVNTFKI